MDKKDPIPFQLRKRERQNQRHTPRKKPAAPRGGGETDDIRIYWTQFFKHPWGGTGRLFWTERMLWGNALIAALATTVGAVLELGFQFLMVLSVFINAFFLFFLIYYMMPWVIDWIMVRFNVRSGSIDGLKLEMIVLSGWLVVVNLLRLVPFYAPLPYYAAMLGFMILILLAVRRQTRAGWPQSIGATAGGALAVLIVLALLSHF